MSSTTRIEWVQGEDGTRGVTWNPTTGCDRVSPGCDHCYALTMAKRLKAMGSAKYQTDGDPRTSGPGFGVAMHEDVVTEPLRWRKPRTVFVNSMSDLFHKDMSDDFLAKVFAVMALTPQHTYQILSKRHARLKSLLNASWFVNAVWAEMYVLSHGDSLRMFDKQPWPIPGVWLGVSAEDQRWADIRIPALMQTPAAVRFVSCEPLLGPIKLHRGHGHCPAHDFAGGFCSGPCPDLVVPTWLIVGGESGRGARPMDLDWVRNLRDDGRSAGAAVFVKQLGSVWATRHGAADRKGGDPSEWPADLRVREMPGGAS